MPYGSLPMRLRLLEREYRFTVLFVRQRRGRPAVSSQKSSISRCRSSPCEELDHGRIGVRELGDIAMLRAFGPEEHAAGYVERFAALRQRTSLLLESPSPGSVVRTSSSGAGGGPAQRDLGALPVRELDLADPEAHGRAGDSELLLDHLHREAVAPELLGLLPQLCFHNRKQASGRGGRRKRAAGLEPATPGLETPCSAN